MKTIYQLVIGMFLATLFTQCNEPQELGVGFFPDESFTITVVDSLSLSAASVRYDSLPTRNTGRLLVGYHEDAKLGKINASAYFQLGFEANKSYHLDKNHTFYDSITLVLTYDGYSFYDTNQVQTIYVHEVLETIEIPDEDTTLYNNTRFHFDQKPLGERAFIARPGRRGTLEIRLSDRLGKAVFDLAVNEDETLSDAADFQEFLKAIVIIPDTTQSGAILGFRPNAALRLSYHDDSQLPVQQKTLDFPAGDYLYFNHIESNRSNTIVAPLIEFEMPIPSQSTNNESFIQSGVGIATRIEIPYLKNLIEVNNDFLISEAILEFYPVSYQNNLNMPLPTTLTAYWVDKNNQSIADPFTAYLRTDNEFDRDTYYQVNITNFVKTQLTISENNQNALLFLPSSDFRNALNALSIGDGMHKNKMRLKIYLISI